VTTIYGKKDCGLCDAAKAKMALLALPFTFRDLFDYDAWREDEAGYRNAMVEHTMLDTLPVLAIGGEMMSYPAAMKKLKEVS